MFSFIEKFELANTSTYRVSKQKTGLASRQYQLGLAAENPASKTFFLSMKLMIYARYYLAIMQKRH